MQEQNFEKQVRQKMEELSLTPSEPVWKNIDAQVRKKRDRRRLFFWLPLVALVIGGGLWFAANNVNSDYSVAKAEYKKNKIQHESSGDEKQTSSEKTIVNSGIEPKNEDQKKEVVNKEEPGHPNQSLIQPEQKPKFSQARESREKLLQGSGEKSNTTSSKITVSRKKDGDLISDQSPKVDNNLIHEPSKSENKKAPEPSVNAQQKEDSSANNVMKNIPGKESPLNQDKPINADTSASMEPVVTPSGADSLHTENQVASNNRKSVSTKWKFAIEAGIASSGVNNGVELFGGGAQSLATNAFARDISFSTTPPTNSQGVVYRPPSTQKKSSSFLLGFVVKKQVSKRSVLSTGLNYSFYSTTMKVGQNIIRDTIVDQNKSVGNFYTNSGSNLSDYRNKFHFVSLPISLDFKPVNQLPLDLHIGLSVQQLVHTNALLFSSVSQVYYNDKEAFNNTFLFSHLGLEYSFPLSKNFSMKAGPRVNYSHSKVTKTLDRHLFSYGLVTQLVFSGN